MPTDESTEHARSSSAPVDDAAANGRPDAPENRDAEPETGADSANATDRPKIEIEDLDFWYGDNHALQGISMGNLFDQPLDELVKAYDPQMHPIVGPLLAAGPSGLVQTYRLQHEREYADACHLCYSARTQLRDQFPMVLCPDSMYGVGIS